MDAVQHFFNKTALFLVIALAVATPGRAAAPVFSVPGTVTLSGSGGQDVPVNSTGGDCATPPCSITFSTSTAYANTADPNWLTISGGNATPTTLAFNLGSTAGLAAGTHTATVTLHATDGRRGGCDDFGLIHQRVRRRRHRRQHDFRVAGYGHPEPGGEQLRFDKCLGDYHQRNRDHDPAGEPVDNQRRRVAFSLYQWHQLDQRRLWDNADRAMLRIGAHRQRVLRGASYPYALDGHGAEHSRDMQRDGHGRDR